MKSFLIIVPDGIDPAEDALAFEDKQSAPGVSVLRRINKMPKLSALR
jgi:hypothetical protein